MKVGVHGASGRVGRALIAACESTPETELTAASVSPGNPVVDSDAGLLAGTGANGVQLTAGPLPKANVDVWIDFSLPHATMALLPLCVDRGCPLVVGTTGFSAADKDALVAAARQIPLVLAPNMSVGVNLAFNLLRTAAEVVGADADIEIVEAHHRNKVDAPSGTAVRMGEIVADAVGRELDAHAVYGRQGNTGVRDRDTIGFATIRAGDIVGEHAVMFATEGERLEITHRASSRANFARGAIRAARWLLDQPAGLYDMQDVLGFK